VSSLSYTISPTYSQNVIPEELVEYKASLVAQRPQDVWLGVQTLILFGIKHPQIKPELNIYPECSSVFRCL
jgi:hypothetical protein